MKSIKVILIFIVFFLSQNLFLWGSTAAAFLNNGASARSEAMGRAFTAVADDLDAFYFNPAGYAGQAAVRINSLGTRINNLYDIYYSGFGVPLWGGYGAINMYITSLGDIPKTGYDSGASDKEYIVDSGDDFDYTSSALFISYGYDLGSRLNLKDGKLTFGFSIKSLNEKLAENKANGTGLDIGFLYKIEDITLGYSIINFIEPQMQWDTDSGRTDVVERKQQIGIAYDLNEEIKLSLDSVIMKFETITGLGLEYFVSKEFAFRMGSYDKGYSFGLGFKQEGANLDYAFVQPYEDIIETTHKVSLGYSFGTVKNKSQKSPLKATPEKEQQIIQEVPKEVVMTEVSITKNEQPELKVKEQTDDNESVPTWNFNVFDKVSQEQPKITLKEQIELEKKTINPVSKLIKCYYKIANKGASQIVVAAESVLINSEGKHVSSYSRTKTMESNTTELFYMPLAEFMDLPTGVYKVKTKLTLNDSETMEYEDSLII